MYETLVYSLEEGVCTIKLNRPDVFNAFNDQLSFDMIDALKNAGRDEQVRVVIITGEGKAFCSGQDLKAVAGQKNRSLSDSVRKRYNPMIKLVREMPKPVIARLNGVAAGAGCSLALACDLIVAAEEATLIEVFINIGLVLDSGSSYFLPRLVGYTKAFEWSTMGTRISAKQAHELGIVTKVVPLADLDEAVKGYTDYYAKAPTKAIGMMKKMLNKSGYSTLDEMLEQEAYHQEIAGQSEDYREGVAAFIEKRKPTFIGK